MQRQRALMFRNGGNEAMARASEAAAALYEQEAGPARRAEPDQVVAERERGEDGCLLSRADAGGAIATGLTEKVELDRPTLADSTW